MGNSIASSTLETSDGGASVDPKDVENKI